MRRYYSDKNLILWLVAVLVPFAYTVSILAKGGMPFWHDPARDLLLGISNLSNFTLIGPPSGIPGFFYGPYWVWILSVGLVFSKDPRIVSFIILTIPYFTIFPFILYRFSKLFGEKVTIGLWLFFIFSFIHYAKHIWSPHLAPLTTLASVYLLITVNYRKIERLDLAKLLSAGFLIGLTANFHISFGIVLMIAVGIFLLTRYLVSLKSGLSSMLLVVFGIAAAFIPTLLFEIRHGFSQLKVFINVITSEFAVVGLWGITKEQIVQEFLKVPGNLFGLPYQVAFPIVLFAVLVFPIMFIRKNFKPSDQEVNLIIILVSALISISYVYLTSKNPVWGYHFIAVEIFFLLLTGMLVGRIKPFRSLFFIWLFVFLVLQLMKAVDTKTEAYSVSDLNTKKYITELIIKDSHNEPYSVKAYNPGIYTYDYDYLFDWLDPQREKNDNTLYLIVPEGEKHQDFVDYQAPASVYKTEKTWDIPDGTIVLKMSKL